MRGSQGDSQHVVTGGGSIVGSAIGSGNDVSGVAITGGGQEVMSAFARQVADFRAKVAAMEVDAPVRVAIIEATVELESAADAERPDRRRIEDILGRIAAWAVPLGLLADVSQIADLATRLL
jgi:hypothetical protein